MKFLLFLLLLPLSSAAQTSAAQIPKKANTIIVDGVTFEKAINTLLDMGYKIDKVDKDFLTAATEFKQPGNKKIKGWEIAISVRVKDNTAIITGEHRDYTSKSESSVTEISYSPSKLLMNREFFGELDAYAKKLSGNVTYEAR